MSKAVRRIPDTFEASSNVGKAAPTHRKTAVIVNVTAKITIQKVKKAAAVAFNAVIQYRGRAKIVT